MLLFSIYSSYSLLYTQNGKLTHTLSKRIRSLQLLPSRCSQSSLECTCFFRLYHLISPLYHFFMSLSFKYRQIKEKYPAGLSVLFYSLFSPPFSMHALKFINHLLLINCLYPSHRHTDLNHNDSRCPKNPNVVLSRSLFLQAVHSESFLHMLPALPTQYF